MKKILLFVFPMVLMFQAMAALPHAFVNPVVEDVGYVRTSAVQANGKLLIAGDIEFVNAKAAQAFVRLNPDGTLDDTFSFPYRIGQGYISKVHVLDWDLMNIF